MFKLLTEEGRQKVAREYVIHRAIVILGAFIGVLVIGIIGFLPSYILSTTRINEILERTRVMASYGEKRNDEADLQAWLKETNLKLQTLSPSLDRERPSDLIEKILERKVAGVSLTGFSLIKIKDNITILVNGVATDRQAFIAFENRISSSEYFSKVTLPISKLAKDRNIDFQIKFSPILSVSPAQIP